MSTGFGALANTVIPPERSAELQLALIRSHAAGMGPEVEREVVRAMMLLRARSLAMGYSGTRPEVVETILALLDAGITPVVPEHGSLGASGDLAPLAAVALVLLGEGEARRADGSLVDGATALAEAGTRAPRPAGQGGPRPDQRHRRDARHARARDRRPRPAAAGRRHRRGDVRRGPARDRPRLRRGSDRDAATARPGGERRQPAALCSPGRRSSPATVTATTGCRTPTRCVARPRCTAPPATPSSTPRAIAARELDSCIDNPVVLPDGRVESCGNFHGAPLAAVADFLAVSIADVGAISVARTDRLLDPARSHGLPPFLAPDAGVNSGLMLAQYGQAAMVAENRRLAVPASTDTLPTSAMQEDHVSLGWSATRKLRAAVTNLARILAVELAAASWGLALRRPLAPAAGTAAVAELVRQATGDPGPDRWLAPRLAAVEHLVADGSVVTAADAALDEPLA